MVPNIGEWRIVLMGKQKLLALGVYPELFLTKAREQRDQARKLLFEGVPKRK